MYYYQNPAEWNRLRLKVTGEVKRARQTQKKVPLAEHIRAQLREHGVTVIDPVLVQAISRLIIGLEKQARGLKNPPPAEATGVKQSDRVSGPTPPRSRHRHAGFFLLCFPVRPARSPQTRRRLFRLRCEH